MMVPSGPPVTQTIDGAGAAARQGRLRDRWRQLALHGLRRARRRRWRSTASTSSTAGTSGGIWGLVNGFCLMIGGEKADLRAHGADLQDAGPAGRLRVRRARRRRPLREDGPQRHRVRAAPGLRRGFRAARKLLPTISTCRRIADLWNQGSVVRSWLLELAERALQERPRLDRDRRLRRGLRRRPLDVQEAIDRDVPAVVLAYSLFARFRSRQDESFGAKLIAALRNEFGGHQRPPGGRHGRQAAD